MDDPYVWGQIAASNAVSDVYAMGGDPILALNLVNWNTTELPSSFLVELLQGASQKAVEGGWLVVGGHSVEDPEPKYGMCVIGEVNPARILKNTGLRPDDVLILTKPLGTGVLTTAIKAQLLSQELQNSVIRYMLQLNRGAKNVAVKYGATGATDITGYGLLGHLRKMIAGQNLDAHINIEKIPLIDGAYFYAKSNIMPSGSKRNLEWVTESVIAHGQDETDLILLADAQTSGGLLFGVNPANVESAMRELKHLGSDAAVVGNLKAGTGQILISPGHLQH